MEETESQKRKEMETRDLERVEKVAKASLELLQGQVESDMEILRKVAPSPEREAQEANLDVQFLKQRQLNLVL